MTLRADHVAGAAFVAFGLLILAISGDLPMGGLSMPGSGFLPKILAAFMIPFGLILIARAGESRPFAEIEWTDAIHAGAVTVITGVAIAVFEPLGFLTTMVLMMVVLLVAVERRAIGPAAIYSV